ncbi:hypothetical protein CALVIDRAFT_542120 [Calocera viscosa TUFC12733]|uniref:Carboxymuconolactone decarboxylase-like domain-containing protein n=1 Tax=Calocera viscosa (strain TUFC12733) TaxID=1330018 RepID=A0A167GZ83_CALVF|nr:hypothetical protein CALVIDRAFT_542120 [Calocera viscosa TUFC12733]
MILRSPSRLFPLPNAHHLSAHLRHSRMAHSSSPAPSTEFLDSLASNPKLQPDTWYLIAAATSVTLGKGASWIPAIYAHAVSPVGPAPAEATPSPPVFADDPLPRRRVVRRLKEALVKGAILHGVPHAIGASLALKDALVPGDRDDSFVREGYHLDGQNAARGYEALHRIYRDEMPLVGELKSAMRDVEWFSYNCTYGAFLAPISDTDPRAPLSIRETEMVVLSCLVALRAELEVKWHLRGSLWVGMPEEEVEAVQCAVEEVARECAGVDVRTGMPRVQEMVRLMKEKEAQKAAQKTE